MQNRLLFYNGNKFHFHYFFMRKFWLAYMAKAILVFPGGFGTLDELFEMLTLKQTRRMNKPMPIVLFGNDYWREVINFDALVRHGTIDANKSGRPIAGNNHCSVARSFATLELRVGESNEVNQDRILGKRRKDGIDGDICILSNATADVGPF